MQPILTIPMMVSTIDFHLQSKSIVIEYVLVIPFNSVFAMNPPMDRNIGTIIPNKIID
jgi:hypothetical protein